MASQRRSGTWRRRGPTIVVSPLIALQRDQVEAMEEAAAGRRRS
ncbi:MAG TPA: hypothetical protein VJU14_13415 [Solirubrobacterales bacterium]|nr:hypothetical protein [Solirubrobacterales bacterium]